mmetsp:Transcript_66606/g.161129  ORF Transcript_66606/g.161129 Transcript_66606/m.161129 type:complete len:97 (+) Transcript_66606:105-395(+)
MCLRQLAAKMTKSSACMMLLAAPYPRAVEVLVAMLGVSARTAASADSSITSLATQCSAYRKPHLHALRYLHQFVQAPASHAILTTNVWNFHQLSRA